MAQGIHRLMKRLTLVLLGLGLLCLVAGSAIVYQYWHEPLLTSGTIEVRNGDGALPVALALRKPRHRFDLLATQIGVRFWQFKPLVGEYAFEKGTSLYQRMQKITKGDVVRHNIVIPPGLTWNKIIHRIASDPRIDFDEVPSLETLGLAEYGSPEGWFYPDTYQFSRPYSASQLIKRAVKRMKTQLNSVWNERSKDLPLTNPYELLILASIVEKETGRDDERARVAGVFISRLRLGMRLQSDPTVIYGLGNQFDGDLRKADLRRYTPYNTYRRNGLPPTPIACPNIKSLNAVAHPVIDGALYFVADGSGGHVFAKTLEEHNKNVRKYQLRKK